MYVSMQICKNRYIQAVTWLQKLVTHDMHTHNANPAPQINPAAWGQSWDDGSRDMKKRKKAQKRMWAAVSHIHTPHPPPSFLHHSSTSLPSSHHSLHPPFLHPPVFPPPPTTDSQQQLTGEVAHFEDKFRNEVQSQGRHTKEKSGDNTHVSGHMHGDQSVDILYHMRCCTQCKETNMYLQYFQQWFLRKEASWAQCTGEASRV